MDKNEDKYGLYINFQKIPETVINEIPMIQLEDFKVAVNRVLAGKMKEFSEGLWNRISMVPGTTFIILDASLNPNITGLIAEFKNWPKDIKDLIEVSCFAEYENIMPFDSKSRNIDYVHFTVRSILANCPGPLILADYSILESKIPEPYPYPDNLHISHLHVMENEQILNTTTLEQSRHIISLGYAPETGDMHYYVFPGDDESVVFKSNSPTLGIESYNLACDYVEDISRIVPAWSLVGLLKLLPKAIIPEPYRNTRFHPVLEFNVGKFYCAYVNDLNASQAIEMFGSESPINAVIMMLDWIKEKGYEQSNSVQH